MNNTPALHLTINGETTTLPDGTTLADAIAHTCGQPNPDGVAAAIGTTIIPRSQWDTPLKDGDTIEILTAVQGG